MPESNLPSGTADGGALSFDDGVSAIESLNIDSEAPNPDEKVEATNEAEADEPETDTPDDADAETDVDAEDPDDSPDEDLKGGRFAPDTAKVTLADGTVTTVAELKRNNLFQADYTRKTTELKTEKTAVEQQKSEVGKIAQAIAQQRDFLLQAAPMFLPKPPDRELMQSDPFGYMQAKAEYDEKMQVVNQLMFQTKAEKDRQAREQEEAANEAKATEAAKLMEAVPEFRDRKVYDQFWNDAVSAMAEFGYTPEELAETTDHRHYRIMQVVVKYLQALKRAPKVAQDIKGKPKIMQGSRRMDPKAKTSREAQTRSENLRKTGSFEAGVSALMDLDL